LFLVYSLTNADFFCFSKVIQKMIERVSPDHLGFISTLTSHVLELASHPFGCRVLQQSVEHLPDVQTQPLLDQLLANHLPRLMQDQFGVGLFFFGR
jgi:pumilio RNA-binding family